MKYLSLSFQITPYNEAAADVLAALLADAGCDTFLPTPDGLTAYILAEAYSEPAIQAAIQATRAAFPPADALPVDGFPAADRPVDGGPSAIPPISPATPPEASASGLSITFTATAAPDENWNATWEAEHHFEPIPLPDGQTLHIIPRQAFGSGEHATTRLMLALLGDLLLPSPSSSASSAPSAAAPSSAASSVSPSAAAVPSPFGEGSPTVIDAGCGTGILGIAALKLGAARAFAYDIDEWSVRNAEENYALNGLQATNSHPAPLNSAPPPAEIRLGDATCLAAAPQADILLANINRNILLADMSTFAAHLKPGGHLLLSGFLEADIPVLTEAATALGLTLADLRSDGDWRALHFTR